MQIDATQALQVLSLLLRALGTRVMQLLCLGMTFGLFGWAMYLQTYLAFGISVAFGFVALWPILAVGWKRGSPPHGQDQQS